MTISKDKLYAALDQNATTGGSTRVYVGLGPKANVWQLHEALGAEPLVTGWSITRAEGGFREDGFWTTEPSIVVEFINPNHTIEADDAFVEAVARWARRNGQETIFLTSSRDLFNTTLDLKSLLEDDLAGV